MHKIVSDIARITPGLMFRIAFAQDHIPELEVLNRPDLIEVGRLLCHESSVETRKEYPIIGDRIVGDTATLGLKIFGNPDDSKVPARYWQLPADGESDE